MNVSDQVTEVGVKYLAEVGAEIVPVGYKQTEVGVIPEDWDCLLAIEVINILAGYSFSSKVSVTSGIRWLKIANVGVNEIKWDTESFLPDNYIEVFKDYLLKENDIVLALTRPILGDNLKVARLSVHDAPALLNQRVARLTSKGSSQNFIHYLVQHSSFIAAMNLAMAGSDPPNIGTKALGNVLVAVPAHEPEQIAIANALSDIDALINELEKLITKKQAIKTATMQQLLTGRTRLPQFALREDGTKKGYKQSELGEVPEVGVEKVPVGYKQTEVGVIPEDWDCLLAIEVINILAGYSFSSKMSVTSGIRWLKIANVGVNEIKWDTESFLPDNYIEVFNDYLLKENDIVLALTRPILGDNLKVARLSVHDAPALLNQRVARLTSKGSSQNFIHYLMQHSSFIAAMNLAMAGSDPPNIGTKALGNILVAVPAHEPEQTAIATILSDMDTEIQTLQQRLSKTRQIKQGMMQELLTGKTRLKIVQSETA